jgi:hypothetical protein
MECRVAFAATPPLDALKSGSSKIKPRTAARRHLGRYAAHDAGTKAVAGAKLRIDIRPDRRGWVLRYGLWDIGIFGDYKSAIAEGIRLAQRDVAETQIFSHNQVSQRFLIWQSRIV